MKKQLLFICMFILLAGELTYGQPIKLWGVTNTGGTNDMGTIFSMNIDGTNFTTHYSFSSPTGAVPFANLVKAYNNKFYGTTHYEGINFFGVIYSFDPATQTYTDVLDFDYNNGGSPNCGLLLATDSNLYGVAEVGGLYGEGVLFRVNPSNNAYTILKHFSDSSLEGGFPSGSLLQASNGLIYGTTNAGGDGTNGTIFSYDISTDTYTKLADCGPSGIHNPLDGLMQASNGLIYGISSNNGVGAAFSFDIGTATVTDIHDFTSGANGITIGTGCLAEINGKLYGMAPSDIDTPSIKGHIYSIDITNGNAFANEFDFSPAGPDYPNGSTPYGHLVKVSDGKLYGNTYTGGLNDLGVAFNFDPSTGTFTKLHDFAGGILEGSRPIADLLEVPPPPCTVAPAKPGSISVSGGSAGVCSGDTRVYSVASVPNVTYNWTPPTGATINSGQGTYTISITFNAGFTSSGTLSVTATNSCGTSPIRTLNIPKSPAPAKPGNITVTGGSSDVCPGDVRTYTVPAVAGMTYSWTLPNGISSGLCNIICNSITITYPVGFTSNSSISVRAHNECGYSSARTISVNRNIPSKPGNITVSGGSSAVCPGDVRTYSVPAVTGMNYLWTLPNGVSAGTCNVVCSSITITYPNTFTSSSSISAAAHNGCGTSSARTLSVTRNNPQTPGPVFGAPIVCVGTTHTYSIAPVAGANSYIWTVPPGASITGPQNGTSINVYFSLGGGAITVKSSNGCGTSSARSRTIYMLCREGELETAGALDAEVFPNPSHDKMTVKFTGSNDEKYLIKVMDMTGRIMVSEENEAYEGINLAEIDISGFAKGMYIISVQTAGRLQQLKAIVE